MNDSEFGLDIEDYLTGMYVYSLVTLLYNSCLFNGMWGTAACGWRNSELSPS